MSSDEKQVGREQDRRKFFRIEDSVSLSFRAVPPGDLAAKLERLDEDENSDFTVMSSLAAISQEMAGMMHRIEVALPDVARYLKALDGKIDLLGRAFMAGNSELSEQRARLVNLSASGMAFSTAEAINVGTILELKLLLLSSFTGILSYSEVVGCERQQSADGDGDTLFQIRVNFSHMRENDRDVLIRHILKRQSALLRREREKRSSAQED
jgi:hypothetical protein